MGLTEGHWFEDEEQLTERQLERAIADEKAAYERGLRDGERISNWISVKDRLPEGMGTVLIAHKGGVSFGWWNGFYWTRGASTKHRPIKTVTHWMPLPEPPKEG